MIAIMLERLPEHTPSEAQNLKIRKKEMEGIFFSRTSFFLILSSLERKVSWHLFSVLFFCPSIWSSLLTT